MQSSLPPSFPPPYRGTELAPHLMRGQAPSGNPGWVGRGLPKLTNEVQHLVKVLSWEKDTSSTIEERCEMAVYEPRDKVSDSVDRSPSTVARELKRNGSRTQGYQPVANQQAHARRWRGSRLERNSALRDQILARLKQGWSPEQVAGRLALETGKRVISHETIYRFYAQLARKKDYTWRQYLPLGKSKRRSLGEGTQPHSSLFLQNAPRRRMTGRPRDTGRPTMLFRTYGQAVLTLHERPLPPDHRSQAPGESLRPHRRGYDNGTGCFASRVASDGHLRCTEFARHHQLHALGIQTFFCYPLALAEGRRGERHRTDASHPAPEDRPRGHL